MQDEYAAGGRDPSRLSPELRLSRGNQKRGGLW